MQKTKPPNITAYLKSIRWFTLFIFLLGPYLAKAQPITEEYRVKSVFLYNFSKFVTWPASCFEGPQSPLIISIVGEDPFDGILDEIITGEKSPARPVIVKRYKTAAEMDGCHILFINYKDSTLVQEALNLTKGRKILTVSDAKNFTSMGGMIAFYVAQNKIRLGINAAAAKEADLVISSKLLRLAEVENR
jgi:uncharacterized protein DUF4154